jgi:hypothetical protein
MINIIRNLLLMIVFFLKFQYPIQWRFSSNDKYKELEIICKDQFKEIDKKNKEIERLKTLIKTVERDLLKKTQEIDEKNKEIVRLKKAIKILESDLIKKDLYLSSEKLFFEQKEKKEKDFFEGKETEYPSFQYNGDKEEDIEWVM